MGMYVDGKFYPSFPGESPTGTTTTAGAVPRTTSGCSNYMLPPPPAAPIVLTEEQVREIKAKERRAAFRVVRGGK